MFIEIFQRYFALFFCCLTVAQAQVADNLVSIELGATDFLIDQPFTISVVIQNSEQRPTITFPTIVGFNKREISTSVTSDEVGGKKIISQVVTQHYIATKPGTYRLPPFTITVNETSVSSEGATLTVRPIGNELAPPTPVVGKNAAYFSLTTSATSVYVGEGFSVKMSLFVAEDYPFELRFDRLEQQLQEILKIVRPFDVWEENVGLSEVKRIPTTVKGKKYTEYRIYEAIYFPLTARAFQMPAVSLTMMALKPNMGKQQKPEALTFTSYPARVEAKKLPPHPLRGQVAVGSFRLQEGVERRALKVGQSIRYNFRIVGEGNIAALNAPRVSQSDVVEVFPPKTQESKNRNGDRVSGYKTFQYFLVPKQNGQFSLEKIFQWIYFDPIKVRYDTLLPQLVIRVGETIVAADTVRSSLPGSIYTGIENLDSSKQSVNWPVLVRAVANVLLVLMILGMIFLLFKK